MKSIKSTVYKINEKVKIKLSINIIVKMVFNSINF